MSRIYRVLLGLIVIAGLVACGNKGELVKPSAPSGSTIASAAQG